MKYCGLLQNTDSFKLHQTDIPRERHQSKNIRGGHLMSDKK